MAKKDITPKDPQAVETTEDAVGVAGEERKTQGFKGKGFRKLGRKTSGMNLR